jgi:hypothetical protein
VVDQTSKALKLLELLLRSESKYYTAWMFGRCDFSFSL